MDDVLDYVLQAFFKEVIPRVSKGSQTSVAMLENLCAKASILMDTIIDIHPKTSKHNGKQASYLLA